ncbi:hypothetical protein ACHAWF_008258, partial [Thalassiosira exigua]
AFSAYDLPSVEAFVRFFHAATGFPVRDTWLRAIKNGNYDSWTGLTYNNAARYCPNADKTLKGHMTQCRQGVRSTKPKQVPHYESPPADEQGAKTNELHVKVVHVSRLYTDDTGRFPVRSRSGNQYIMVAYHCNANVILACPFKTRKDKHRLVAYNAIMERLAEKKLAVDLQILDNEASEAYRDLITKTWKHKFQLVPPNMHRRNAAERAIRTFKAHFLSILAGVAPDFPRYLWDMLIPQAEMTLNFLRNAKSNERMSAWEFFSGPFDYDATPLGPLGARVIAHNKPSVRNSWDFRGEDGWSIGAAMLHYRSQRYVACATHEERVNDTVEFRHPSIHQPRPTPDARSHSPLRQLQGWRHPSRRLPNHPCSPFTRRTGRTRRNPSRAEPVPKRRRLRQLQGWSRSQCERDPVDSPSRRALHAFSARWPLQRRQLAWRPPCPVASIKPPPHRLRPD